MIVSVVPQVPDQTGIGSSSRVSFRACPDRILRRREVCDRIGLRRSALYQAMKEGRFPASVPLGPRAVGWLDSEVTAWLQERVAERNAGGAR